jgi:hypothetical protein
MAEITLAYCSSRGPTAATRDRAPERQRRSFLAALHSIRADAHLSGVQACVLLSNDRFTNFFLDNVPQICVGLGERNRSPRGALLPAEKRWIPGHAALAGHITNSVLNAGFDPAFSHLLDLDRGALSVYRELDPLLRLPLVPIVQNCAVAPLMPVRRWYEFGLAMGEAIRSYEGLDRVAVVGTGGLSHYVGVPGAGDIDEDFDRWFLDRLERGDVRELLDLTDEEIELAGNGAHEIRSWLAVAGAAAPGRGYTLAYEPIYPWTTGVAVSRFEMVA